MRRPTRPIPHSSTHKTWFFILALLLLAAFACNLPFLANRPASPAATVSSAELAQALAVTPRDDRPEIIQRMSRPDAFRITFEALNGQMVRYEEWSYFDDQTCLSFMDGTLVSTVQLEALPDGSIFASDYDPQSFTAGMSVAGVKSLLAGQEFVEQDTAETGEAGGLLLASRQILLGFDNGQLVYVETLVLTPEAAQ